MSAPTAPPPVRTQTVPERVGRVAEVRALSRTTPGVLILFIAALVVVSVVVGVVTAISVQSRAQALDNLSGRSGPLSVAAQDLYRSLSDADATANSAFLEGGVESKAVRDRYEKDIADAQHALAIAVAAREPADLADPNSPLAVLSSQLSVYTGIVETARANNLQGNPVGAAYQREASTLMHKLLAAAQSLYEMETQGVDDDQDSATSWLGLVVEVLLGLATLVLLFYAQRYVRRRTRRRINVGLAIATVAALASLVWVLAASIGVMANVHASRENGSDQTKILADARINVLAARGDETLTLVARGSGAKIEDDYKSTRKTLATQQLPGARDLATDVDVRADVQTAIDQEIAWHKTHREIRDADDQGDFPSAVDKALTGAAKQFDQVDQALDDAIGKTTNAFDQEVSQASDALAGLVIGVILLALVTAAGAVAGIWQRLKEYR
jgi:tetrahydromethanopterin S-methyltransferase subunit G